MKKLHWLAPCANILCLIHCIGFGLLGILSPVFLTTMPHVPALDWSLVGINVILGTISLKTMKENKLSFSVLYGLALSATISLIFDKEVVFHLAIFANAIFQVVLLVKHHKKDKKHKDCCSRDHK